MITKLTGLSALTTAVSLALPFVALASAIALPLTLLASAPFIFVLLKDQGKKWRKAQESAIDTWRSMPQRSHLEIVTDLYGTPAVISHKRSTAIVYANAAAREVLGEGVVGRTLYPEEGADSRPICLNGAKVDGQNHPAALVQTARGPVEADMVWAKGDWRIPFAFQAQPIYKGREDEFSLVTFQFKERELVALSG